jgi:hypothetical protein
MAIPLLVSRPVNKSLLNANIFIAHRFSHRLNVPELKGISAHREIRDAAINIKGAFDWNKSRAAENYVYKLNINDIGRIECVFFTSLSRARFVQEAAS